MKNNLNGKYKTEKGSTVTIIGKYSERTIIEFDWFEEEACSDCYVIRRTDGKELIWVCDLCGGGSAKLTKID